MEVPVGFQPFFCLFCVLLVKGLFSELHTLDKFDHGRSHCLARASPGPPPPPPPAPPPGPPPPPPDSPTAARPVPGLAARPGLAERPAAGLGAEPDAASVIAVFADASGRGQN